MVILSVDKFVFVFPGYLNPNLCTISSPDGTGDAIPLKEQPLCRLCRFFGGHLYIVGDSSQNSCCSYVCYSRVFRYFPYLWSVISHPQSVGSIWKGATSVAEIHSCSWWYVRREWNCAAADVSGSLFGCKVAVQLVCEFVNVFHMSQCVQAVTCLSTIQYQHLWLSS